MKLVQVGAPSQTKKILSVDPNTFAKLIDVSEELLTFDFFYLISISNAGKSIFEYDRVEVTVLPQENSSVDVPAQSYYTGKNDGLEKYSINFRSAEGAGNVAPVQKDLSLRYAYPAQIETKLFAGKDMLQKSKKKQPYIAKQISYVGTALYDVVNKNFSMSDLVPSVIRKSTISESRNFEALNHGNIIDGINRYLYDVTSPAEETQFDSRIDFSNLKTNEDSALASFHAELLRYYLQLIPPSPEENAMVFYDKVSSINSLNFYEGKVTLKLPSVNKNLNLNIKFDLFKKESLIPEETVISKINISRHVTTYMSISNPPHVSCVQDELGYVKLMISDTNGGGSVKGFNIYSKNLNENGTFSEYQLLGTLQKSNVNHFEFFTKSKLSIIRVSPIDSSGTESNIFTSTVVGRGFENINNLAICPRYDSNGKKISIDVYNIPRDTVSLTLFKRSCGNNINSFFRSVSIEKISQNVRTYSLDDIEGTRPGEIFEYYVIASRKKKIHDPSDQKIISNYSFVRHPLVVNEGKVSSVKIKNFVYSPPQVGSDPSVSFTLETNLSRENKELILNLIKSQIPEIYDQFLNPANNSSSPLSEEKFSDLIVHEVVRTNLSTAEREIFNVVAEGNFVDDAVSQKLSNVKPIDPLHDYLYQVFTYKKNPMDFLKNYVVSGVDEKGKEWFYLPYKWLQPVVRTTGKLYPDDKSGVPIIDTYESITSEPLGLSASKLLKNSQQISKISAISAERLDKYSVLISWSASTNNTATSLNFYDSFIVMKVVNGVRSFIGRTSKNYIYHLLSEDDMGTVYYVILPIMKDFSFDEAYYSNSIFVDSKISKKLMLPKNTTLTGGH